MRHLIARLLTAVLATLALLATGTPAQAAAPASPR